MNTPNPIHASAVEKDLSGSAGASPAGVPAPDCGVGYVLAHNLIARLLVAYGRFIADPSDATLEAYNDIRREMIAALSRSALETAQPSAEAQPEPSNPSPDHMDDCFSPAADGLCICPTPKGGV